ncbi:MAG: electron transfer flavoprotein subunit beta/FixA family protein [Rhodospirillales bacterium]
MRFAVCLTLVPDPDTIEVDPLTGEIDRERTLYILNPADAVALEMALRLRSRADVVTALTVGPEETDTVLRDALAVGADHAIRVWDDTRTGTKPAVTSVLLAAALRTEGLPDLIFCGWRSLGRGSGKMPALLGEYLDWPVVTAITQLDIQAARVTFRRRLARGGQSEGEVTMPAVLAIAAENVRLRYASLPGLMQARRATIPVRHLPDLGLSPQDLRFPASTVHVATPPRPRPRTIFVPDSHLPPHERVGQILSAGAAQKVTEPVTGTPEEMADVIVDFLDERGFLEPPA